MLGWEFPPYIAGGLGTACFGLTRGLNKLGHEILFVLPRPLGRTEAEHVTLIGPDAVAEMFGEPEPAPVEPPAGNAGGGAGAPSVDAGGGAAGFEEDEAPDAPAPGPAVEAGGHAVRRWVASSPQLGGPIGRAGAGGATGGRGLTEVFEIDAPFRSPYGSGEAVGDQGSGQSLTSLVESLSRGGVGGSWEVSGGGGGGGGTLSGPLQGWSGWLRGLAAGRAEDLKEVIGSIGAMKADASHYGTDLMGDAERYAKVVAALALRTQFDVIHAHDWLTYPAGLAVKALTGKPLVCHVHATEFDRSGDHINQQVYDIERAGITGADRVIVVSQLTRTIAVHRYAADPAKVDVIYNGVENAGPIANGGPGIASDDKIVLFLGRITLQKGPEYFIRAAKRVLEKVEKVKFVVAGSGDMAVRMIEEAAALGIGHKVLFTGFLRGRDVQRVFRMADCYVMPSVSEPFGIAALEAMQQDTPVIISKQSGVSEVLSHALKVDFWDVDDMANKIVAVLKYPPLSQTLREHGAFEVRHLTWDGAAEKATKTYGRAIGGV